MMSGKHWSDKTSRPPSPGPPEEEPLGLPVPQEPRAGDDRPDADEQVEADRQITDPGLHSGKPLDGNIMELMPHLTAKEGQEDQYNDKHKADNTSKVGHPVGRAFHPGGGVGAENAAMARFPGQV